MLGVSEGTAEEFHSWCRASAATLREAAAAHAVAGRTVSAVADAWSADISSMQAAIWGRLVIGSHSPQRVFFQTAQPIAEAVATHPVAGGTGATALDAIRQARAGALAAFTDDLARAVASDWPELGFLGGLPAPTQADVDDWTRERLGGLSTDRFIADRRQRARERMRDAQMSRMRGETSEAVNAAYESDYRMLEAYLVESAVACGDAALMSVGSRTDLVSAALASMPVLPGDFLRAAQVIRTHMCQALGEADGGRFARVVLDLQSAG